MLSAVREFIDAPDPGRFPELALALFRFQYEGNATYRRFCDRRGGTPANVTDWTEIPAVPVSAFKQAELVVSGLPEGSVFVTSGTTEGAGQRGRHRVPDPSIYRAAALAHFARCVLPDGARPRFLVLAPSLAEQPQSSLCQMIEWLAESFAPARPNTSSPAARFRPRRSSGGFVSSSRRASRFCLIGVTYAFIRFIDRCRRAALAFVCRTGRASSIPEAPKGRSRSMSRNGLLRAFWEQFGVPGYFVANEYGMTEMCSQFYDDAIHNHVAGRKRDRAKLAPQWVRTRVMSPQTLEPVPRGERGLLRHFDLANVGLGARSPDRGRRASRSARGSRSSAAPAAPRREAARCSSSKWRDRSDGARLSPARRCRGRARPAAFGTLALAVAELSADEMRALLARVARRRPHGEPGDRAAAVAARLGGFSIPTIDCGFARSGRCPTSPASRRR